MFYKGKYLGDTSNIFAVKLVNQVPRTEGQTTTPNPTISTTTLCFVPKSVLQFMFYRVAKLG